MSQTNLERTDREQSRVAPANDSTVNPWCLDEFRRVADTNVQTCRPGETGFVNAPPSDFGWQAARPYC